MRVGNACIYLLIAMATLAACRTKNPAVFPCPAGFAKNAPREAEIQTTLTRLPEGEQLYNEMRERIGFCFGPIAVSSVTTEGALLLDETLSNEEAAARVGHLLRHVRDGLSAKPKPGERCEDTSARLLVQEAEALDVELSFREALALKAPHVRYEIEPAWRDAPKEKRVSILLEYLKANPNGAPGIEALARGYERRCRLGLP